MSWDGSAGARPSRQLEGLRHAESLILQGKRTQGHRRCCRGVLSVRSGPMPPPPPPLSSCLPAWITLQSVRQSPEPDLAFAARSLCWHSSVLMLLLRTSTGTATRASHVSPQLRNLQKLRAGQSCPYPPVSMFDH